MKMSYSTHPNSSNYIGRKFLEFVFGHALKQAAIVTFYSCSDVFGNTRPVRKHAC